MQDTTPGPDPQRGPVLLAEAIPPAMRAAKRWLLHRGGSKQPFYVNGRPRSGKLDSERDIAQLASFEEACTVIDASHGLYAGLGFALGDGWHGGDLDGCRNAATGLLTPWAKAIIEACATYVEISQSGKGLHVLTYDAKHTPDALGANGSGAEFYSKARYFIVTGNMLKPAPKRWPSAGKVRALFEERWSNGHGVMERRIKNREADLSQSGGSLEWPGFALELSAKLAHVPPGRPRGRWLAISMGIHHASGGSEQGFRLWHDWSAKAEDGSYTGEADLRRQWVSFKVAHKKPVTWGTVRKYLDEFTPAPLPEDAEGLPYADILAEPQVRAPIIEGWLYERTVLLQAADGGTGKSYMGLLEAMMVALGRDCGMGWKVEPGRVLFYSGEDDADVIRLRMRLYCAYYGWRMEDLREGLIVVDRSETDCVLYSEGRGGTGEFTGEYARLVKTVQRVDPCYVVIDNASHVFNGNENNRATVRHFLSGLTALRRAVNLLAHVNKVTAGTTSANQAVAYSGSTAWNNTVRARRAQSMEEGRGSITIAKSNYGPTGTSLRYDWDDRSKLFLPRTVVGREHARDHAALLLDIVKQLEGRLASLDARAPNHLAKLIQAHPSCPRGIDLKALKRWTEEQLTRGRIEERELMKPNRRPGKTYVVC